VNPLQSGDDPRIRALLDSHERLLGRPLCTAAELFEAPFVVLAHGTESPPLLFYGNRRALSLWEMAWDTFTSMPSHRTAEPDLREDRARVLADVQQHGFTTGYSGVRISATGRRFAIRDATVWNILEPSGRRIGQAAAFDRAHPLSSRPTTK
jgi:hypothetical protein